MVGNQREMAACALQVSLSSHKVEDWEVRSVMRDRQLMHSG